MTTSEDVRNAAGLPDNPPSRARADLEFGQQLSAAVQKYLADNRSQHDLDLFFEECGRPPRDGSSWPEAVIKFLDARGDISQLESDSIVEQARQAAVAALLG